MELVNLGFLNYKKLTAKNYDYWWYEVEDISKIDKKAFTFDWLDLIPTSKMEMIKEFIVFHDNEESAYNLILAILNIESARFDGIDINTGKSEFERQIEFYYGNKTEYKQLEIF